MKRLWMPALFVLIWCGFSNSFHVLNILMGSFIVSMLWLTKAKRNCYIKLWPLIKLLILVIIELIKSSLLVSWEVIIPKSLSNPAIIHIDLACLSNEERTLLVNLISLTPGTLSIDLTPDKKKVIIHAMFAKEPQKMIDFVKNKLQPYVTRVFDYG